MMLTGGIGVYPTLQDYLAPTDPDSLEFSVTATAPVGVAAVEATVQPQAPFSDVTRLQTEATASTALPPLFLPETEYIIASDTQTAPKPEQFIEENAVPEATPEAAATPQPTPEPTLSPSPTPTPDPASLLPARLEIPAIGLDAPVMQVGWETQEVNGQLVSNWIVPDRFAAGWHVNSAAPGQPGNTVLNGHNNIHGNVFRDLKDLQPGDEVTVYSGEVSLFSIQTLHHYVVTERHILEEMYQPAAVRQQNAQFIMPTSDERLTLVTCWPNTSNTHRLVIVALPAEVMPTPAMGAE
jgi:sortase A